jgi:P-type Cu2+ transporter
MTAAIATLAKNACLHCGLPSAGKTFCCAGCEVVHEALAANGLDGYYGVAERIGGDRGPARTTAKTYAELDDPTFRQFHAKPRPDGLAEVAFFLEDVRCAACVWLVERVPSLCDGVVEVRLDLGKSRADVVFDPARASLAATARMLDRLGHPVHPYRGADRDGLRRKDDRALLLKIGVAGAAWGNVMLLAIALYAGMFGGMAAGQAAFFRWTSMLVAVPALSFAATPFFRGAIGALTTRRLHLDLPIAIGILVGILWGALNTVRGTGEIYFDSLSMLVFLLLVSRWVQSKQHRKAASAAELLHALTPRTARRVGLDGVDEVPLEAIVAGDRVEVRAGDTIPVDGYVLAGRSAIDAGLLTGESRPVEVSASDPVHAGTVNVVGPLTIAATAAGEATRIGQLAMRIEDEGRRRAPIQRFVDRVAGRFVAVVLVVAGLTALGWSLTAAGPGAGFEHAMALLIVTCPCALALATPLAVSIALGRAARRSILVKGGDALERLATPGQIFVDKTGTLTEGRIRLTDWIGDADARVLAVAVERGSAHPLARALVEADGGPTITPAADDVHEVLGGGIEGTVGRRRVLVGAPVWIAARADVSPRFRAVADTLARSGKTPVLVAVDAKVVAVAGFADTLRPDAAGAIDLLRARGWTVGILSGDDPRIARAIGASLGLPRDACQGGVTPEGKLAAIRAARAAGPVVMVGDGVNDAAAMAAATCGIAVHGSAEASIDAADVLVRRPGLAPLVELFDGAAATMAVIRRNLRVSLAYNLIGGTLAVTGLIHPLIAALMMPLSSLSVLFSSSRSSGFTDRGGAS